MPARLPIEVVKARGAKHLTKEEIRLRQESEIKPIADDIVAPDYLTKKQKDQFYKLANQLTKLKILGETDVDALGRYITSNDFYINAVKQLRKPEIKSDPMLMLQWSKAQDQFFKQCRSSANDLGLSISARCKLVVPEPSSASSPKVNKFSAFEKTDADD